MSNVLTLLSDFFTQGRIVSLIRAVSILVVGILFARLIAGSLAKIIGKYTGEQQALLSRKIVYYSLTGLIIATALREMGFQLSVLLGAAGILTVALGFASQTSASNLISGLFLLADRSFLIGDVIKVGETVGIVTSVELISVKLRTFQNAFVRIPNEEMIKSQVINYTRWPIRRIDIEIGVAYKENISRVREILFQVAEKNSFCLEDPPPLFIFTGYGDSAINLQFCVWCMKDNYLLSANSIKQEIKEAFDKDGIEIPFPHRTICTGSSTAPWPVEIVNNR